MHKEIVFVLQDTNGLIHSATSAFNNLGVTFFAPRDFIGHTCVTSPATLGSNATSNLTSNSVIVDRVETLGYSAPRHDLLSEFFLGTERAHKHNTNTDYNTPMHLTQECSTANQKCSSYKYDTGIWISTIIDEWDLVCDRAWLISLTQSLYMSGFILAYLIFGYLSDRYGRWRALLIGAIIEVSCGFGCAFSSSITEFMFFRFFLGLGNAGRSSSSYLIMIEWTGADWRMHISTLGSLGWVVGYSLMPYITLYFLHFRHMQLFVCFFEIIFVLWFLRLPESPRWLLTHKRWSEAHDVLLMAAKYNGLIINEDQKTRDKFNEEEDSSPYVTALANVSDIVPALDRKPTGTICTREPLNDAVEVQVFDGKKSSGAYTLEEFERRFQRLTKMIESKEFSKNEDRLSILDLFKWKNLRKYLSILAIAWASNSFIYYGLALKVGDTKGTNLFLAFFWGGLTEIPAIIFSIALMKFLPRKTTNICMFAMVGLLTGLQLPLKYYSSYPWLSEATNILAKLFNSCSFTCVLYQTIELFPTSIRQNALSAVSLSGRFGSILAPFVKELEKVTNQMVPGLIYLTLSLIEIVLIRKLPETQGTDLPDTLIEAEKFKGTSRKNKKSASSSTADITDNESNLSQSKPAVVVTM